MTARNQATEMLRTSWSRCWTGLAARGDGHDVFEKLIESYREPQRKYHTLQHLAECLALFDRYQHLAIHPHEVEIALWFHDAIYEVRAGDNEARSADWARASLRDAGVANEACERVHEHVLATRHAALPIGQDQALLVDIDLSILGAPEARFDEYEAQVRAEYGWVPDFLFKRKRREILAEFLARAVLYSTPALRDALESAARKNLSRSLAGLH